MSEEQDSTATPKKKDGFVSKVEFIFENFLWFFRFIIVLGVIGLLLSSSVVFILGIKDTLNLTTGVINGKVRVEAQESYNKSKQADRYKDVLASKNDVEVADQAAAELKEQKLPNDKYFEAIIVRVIRTVDFFLLGTVLLIFSLGTYDLFISKIDQAIEQDDIRPDWLVFSSLEELKAVLGKVVLMILTINFLKYSTKFQYDTALSLLYLGAGIALVSLALRLTRGHDIDETKYVPKGEGG